MLGGNDDIFTDSVAHALIAAYTLSLIIIIIFMIRYTNKKIAYLKDP